MHGYADRLTAVEAVGVQSNFFTGEEPAHGQRFQTSDSIPPLDAIYANQVMSG